MSLLCSLHCVLFELRSVCRSPQTTHRPFSARRGNSRAHNCTSRVVSPSGIFRSVNVLAIPRSWGEEIKKLNKRVGLKHTSLNLTKTLRYSLIVESNAPKQNSIYSEEGNRKPTISPTRRGERRWQWAELQPHYAIPHTGVSRTLE